MLDWTHNLNYLVTWTGINKYIFPSKGTFSVKNHMYLNLVDRHTLIFFPQRLNGELLYLPEPNIF